MKILIVSTACLLCAFGLWSQPVASVREVETGYTTYPYSDPNPLPADNKLYPYFRFDGFTVEPEQRIWKVVELENDYLLVKIMPQIGGKVWTAIDKTTGHAFIYNNDVVKFRDIALRGPWTSGGIEFNYGIVGHAPTCSTMVDYMTRENDDGSVSCIIRMPDLLTRTTWSIEINLPPDKAWFTTRSLWHNASGFSQPYYNWFNAGVRATRDVEFIYPGTRTIGHDGLVADWPFDSVRNKDLSKWAQNDFDGAKSYHIAGTYTRYFGAYWPATGYGMLHYAAREDKLGKKLFLWALSDEGKIWEELLTDDSGQYVELQSGRLFNQNMAVSTLTPHKQTGFTPYGTDVWGEYWFAYNHTGGVSHATLTGVVHVESGRDVTRMALSPLIRGGGAMEAWNSAGERISDTFATLEPGKLWTWDIPCGGVSRLTFNGDDLWNDDDKTLSRPVSPPDDFDWESAYGQYVRGRDLSWMRDYKAAEGFAVRSLAYNPDYLPALNLMSRLAYRRMDYPAAWDYAQRALRVDTYDPYANYLAGCAALRLGKWYDALDCFGVAALGSELRSAACTRLAGMYLVRKDFATALGYAEKSLLNNALNIDGLQLGCLAASSAGDPVQADAFLRRIETLDPLNHFVTFERYYAAPSDRTRMAFTSRIVNEMAVQTYLEMGVYYHGLGLDDRAKTVLGLSPGDAETAYWRAYLEDDPDRRKALLTEADHSDLHFVFPFREESADVFTWAEAESGNWRPKYLLALLHNSRNNTDLAIAFLRQAGEVPDFAPFYGLRAKLDGDDAVTREADLRKAIALEPTQWRYRHALTRFYLSAGETGKAIKTIEGLYRKNPGHFHTGILYVRALIRGGRFAEAEHTLTKTYILPFEGAYDGFWLQEHIKIMLAVKEMFRGRPDSAVEKLDQARQWPRHLGVGKPYDTQIDNRMVDWFTAVALSRAGDDQGAEAYITKVASKELSGQYREFPLGYITVLQSAALYRSGDREAAEKLRSEWELVQTDPQYARQARIAWEFAVSDQFASDEAIRSYIPLVEKISAREDTRLFI